MWITRSILSFCLLNISVNGHDAAGRGRQRRYLLFTPNTQWGVFATVSVPLKAGSLVSVAWFFEANYYNVANASYFEPLLGDIEFPLKRSQRSTKAPANVVTRSRVYAFLESTLQQHGQAGRACLLRAICEGSTSHFWHNGVLGDVFQLILTPSTSISEDDIEDCYYEAEYYGLENKCIHYARDCPFSLLDYITMSMKNE